LLVGFRHGLMTCLRLALRRCCIGHFLLVTWQPSYGLMRTKAVGGFRGYDPAFGFCRCKVTKRIFHVIKIED